MTFYIYQISNIIYFIYRVPIWYLSGTYLAPIWYLSGTYLVPIGVPIGYLSGTYLVPIWYPNFGTCTPPIWYLIYTRYILFRPVNGFLKNKVERLLILFKCFNS